MVSVMDKAETSALPAFPPFEIQPTVGEHVVRVWY